LLVIFRFTFGLSGFSPARSPFVVGQIIAREIFKQQLYLQIGLV
jgi:hypothetical protein